MRHLVPIACLLAQAITNTGITASTSPEEACETLIAEFGTIEITGVTGTMKWDETGAVEKTPIVVVIENGNYVMLKN